MRACGVGVVFDLYVDHILGYVLLTSNFSFLTQSVFEFFLILVRVDE
jgi:hypothetical protein